MCIPLFDPEARLGPLKNRVAHYPEALRRAVVQDYLWAVEFGLRAFAPKFAARADAYGTASCLTRAVNQLVLSLFALNRKYPINDKTVLIEVAEFGCAPEKFGQRVLQILSCLGSTPAELAAAVEGIQKMFQEIVELAEGLYQPRYPSLPF